MKRAESTPTGVGEPLYTTVDSPLGELLLVSDGHALRGLHMQEGRKAVLVAPGWHRSAEPFGNVRAQLEEYFAGQRAGFDLPLDLQGTPFQRRVWAALEAIAYGTTTTYGALAAALGVPRAVRAVGAANGRNPLSIVRPCHRVVGASGALTGYGGGLEAKRTLLGLEARTPVEELR